MAVWSEVPFSRLSTGLRFEAEYFQPKYLELEDRLSQLQCLTLGEATLSIRSGPFGSNLLKATYVDHGVIVLRPFNIKDAATENDNLVHITEQDCEASNLTQYRAGDVAFARVGDIRCGVVADYGRPVTISPNIIIARVRESILDPYFLAIYMNTPIGSMQMERAVKIVAQPTITVDTIKSVLIPIIPLGEQREIGDLLRQSLSIRHEALKFYAEAETLLLRELGLDRLDLSHQITYEAYSSEAMAAGRLDAEYFQPKYVRLIEHIERTGQAIKLGDWVRTPIRRGVLPNYDNTGEVIVINSQHVGKTHIELEDNRFTTREFTAQNRRAVVQHYDVLLNSTGYITIGRCQTMLDDVEAIVDGHVSIIRPKEGLDPVYLGLFLNSSPGQLQTEQSWTGSSGQIELRTDSIADYVVWMPPVEIQLRIREMIEESHTARKEAARLLEEAKQRVEKLIEGEE